MTARLRLTVAGAGAAGSALAAALARAGWPLAEIACRSAARAEQRCAAIGGGRPCSLDALAEPSATPLQGARLLLIAVPDRVVGAIAGTLAARPWPPGSVALHLSGSVEVQALAPLAAAGLSIGGLHPLRSFVDLSRDVAGLPGTVMAIEGESAALACAERVATDLQGHPFRLDPGMRPAWHAAATHAANHLVALLDQSLDLAETAGLPRDRARAALVGLQRSTLENLSAHPPGAALTGPIVRGDVPVVARHLAALAQAPPDLQDAYRALAVRAVQLANEERDLPDDVARALLDRLRESSS